MTNHGPLAHPGRLPGHLCKYLVRTCYSVVARSQAGWCTSIPPVECSEWRVSLSAHAYALVGLELCVPTDSTDRASRVYPQALSRASQSIPYLASFGENGPSFPKLHSSDSMVLRQSRLIS